MHMAVVAIKPDYFQKTFTGYNGDVLVAFTYNPTQFSEPKPKIICPDDGSGPCHVE